jgi:aminoglycoside phosphotransferase (APT) family kinase protein
MEDAGSTSRDLKTLLLERPLSEETLEKLGTELGRFLAIVHGKGSEDEALMSGVRESADARKLTGWITYGRIIETLANGSLFDAPSVADHLSSDDIERISHLADQRIQQIREAQEVFTVGDFWTGNIVLRLDDEGKVERVYVIDWEMAKPGLPFLDFAQCAAELYTLGMFQGNVKAGVDKALQAYGASYADSRRISKGFICDAGTHVGAHLVTITPWAASWEPRTRRKEVVKEGIEYLLRGMDGSLEWLRMSAVGGVFDIPVE